MNRMQAVVLHEPREARLEMVPRPDPGPGEVIVKVEACGLCGTDLKIYEGEYLSPYPLIPGHEISGTVVRVGSGADPALMGTRVGVDPTLTCGTCAYCRSGHPNHCEHWGAIGDTTNGGFAEYVAVPAKNVYPLLPDQSFALGALLEPMACAAWALEKMPVQPGSTALLFGAGPMGLILMQMLLRSGVGAMDVVDLSPRRNALARELGARTAYTPDDLARLEAGSPDRFDLVVEATGVAAVLPQALRWVKPAGSLLLFGVAPRGATAAIEPYQLYHQEITLYTSMAINQSYPLAGAMAGQGWIRADRLVSHTLPLTRYTDAINLVRTGEAVKVQLGPAGA